jgi:hypothetical protein
MLMILQANGPGNNNGLDQNPPAPTGGGFARSVVELYNNTNATINFDLTPHFLHIHNSTEWTSVIKLTGSVSARSSFLVVDNTDENTSTSDVNTYNTNPTPRAILPVADQYAPFVLVNNVVIVALMRTGDDLGNRVNPFNNPTFADYYVDLLGEGSQNIRSGDPHIYETAAEGGNGQSRPQGPRRESLTDTYSNKVDFSQVDFPGHVGSRGMADTELYKFWPRDSTMGPWDPITGLPAMHPQITVP